MPYCGQQRHWLAVRTQYHANSVAQERQELVRHLCKLKVQLCLDLVLGIGVEPPVLDVSNDAYDLRLNFQNTQVETFSYRVPIWEVFVRQKFVDYHNWRRLFAIRL